MNWNSIQRGIPFNPFESIMSTKKRKGLRVNFTRLIIGLRVHDKVYDLLMNPIKHEMYDFAFLNTEYHQQMHISEEHSSCCLIEVNNQKIIIPNWIRD
ncbi:hypothetical protein EWB00_010968 [Schistosoma japonicum]|uniref:Uncharacterized protein n=1 Tax=Schistosoma japonicum TaxID=6182 RepID=A0A4Z2DLY5_SCHJA|nr:hypothetical protein KSF78_0006381 [Schistosoma japonicum]TNN17521.1 hypothetical protein EWB00_010968 [Schistosoma japonicum]